MMMRSLKHGIIFAEFDCRRLPEGLIPPTPAWCCTVFEVIDDGRAGGWGRKTVVGGRARSTCAFDGWGSGRSLIDALGPIGVDDGRGVLLRCEGRAD